jgi:hypothetical protein
MKQSRAVESSARLLGFVSSSIASVPLKTALAAWRTLVAA